MLPGRRVPISTESPARRRVAAVVATRSPAGSGLHPGRASMIGMTSPCTPVPHHDLALGSGGRGKACRDELFAVGGERHRRQRRRTPPAGRRDAAAAVDDGRRPVRPSLATMASRSPSALQVTSMKGAMAGPGSTVKASRPVSMSHTRTLPSKRAAATSRPSGLTSRETRRRPMRGAGSQAGVGAEDGTGRSAQRPHAA